MSRRMTLKRRTNKQNTYKRKTYRQRTNKCSHCKVCHRLKYCPKKNYKKYQKGGWGGFQMPYETNNEKKNILVGGWGGMSINN